MRARLSAALALAVLGFWHLGLRAHGFQLPMMSDEGEYAVQARLIAQGGVPYRDAYNQKPPLTFFLYRLAAGVLGPGDSSPRFLAALFCWAMMGLLFALTPPEWSMASRLGAPAVLAVLSTQPIGDLGFAANTEVFLAGFTCLSAWALLGSLDLLAGLAMGAALMTKQTALWTGLAFFALASKRGRFALGAAAVPAAVLLYLAKLGAVHDFREQVFTRNMDYASVILATSSLGAQLRWFLTSEVPLFLRGGWPALALAGLGLSKTRVEPGRRLELLTTLWLGSALVGAVTGLFFFPHYFLPALPPLALAAAMGVEKLRRHSKLLLGALCLYPAAAFFPLYFLDPPTLVARKLLFPNPLYESLTAAAYINEHSKPEDRIYIFGSEPQIYVYAQRAAATRHDFVFPLTLFPRGRAEIAAELAALEAVQPKFIVYVNLPASTLIASALGEEFRRGVSDLLEREYRLAGVVPIRDSGPAGFEPASIAGPGFSKHGLYIFRR